jgi:hypothetical protein
VGVGVGHGDRRLVGEGLEELEVLGGERGVRALAAEEEEAAELLLEAEGHGDLGAERRPFLEGGRADVAAARIGGHLLAG